MIKTIKHKGLQRLYEQNDARGLRTDLVPNLRRFLAVLETADTVRELDLPGYRLTSNLQDHWSATLSRNHRIIFRFEDNQALDVDLVDYH